MFDARNIGNKLSLTHSLAITRAIYSSEEYHFLKELFNRILQIQNGDLVFTRQQKAGGGR